MTRLRLRIRDRLVALVAAPLIMMAIVLAASIDDLGRRADEPLGLAAIVTLVGTLALYAMMSRNIVRQLQRLGDEALDLCNGIVPATPTAGHDEIAQLRRSLRTAFAIGHEREKRLKKYEQLTDQAALMIFWIDANDTIVEANRAAADGYGYSCEQLVAMGPGSLRANDNGASFAERVARARELGSVTYEGVHVRSSGEKFPVEVWLHATVVDEQPMIVAVVRDVTDRKRAEAAATAYRAAVEASLRLRSEFVATMSHEIRTPMNAVIGMTELLLDSDLGREQRQHSEIIRDASFALLGIIDDVLDFSKIEAGQLELEHSELDVVDLVEAATAVLADKAHRKGIALMASIDDGVPATVVSDKLRIRQVLINLIGNAVKFTDAGSVVVSVRPEGQVGRATFVRFAVRDTGIGIDEATAQKIFEPFRQADGSTTRKYGGTGLGLSISRRLVNMLGGELVVESRPGAGSEFSFVLMLEPGQAIEALPPSPLVGRRALVVDDDETARTIYERLLQRWDVRCTSVADGDEALATLRRAAVAGDPFDVALVDHRLPGCDGLALGGAIKRDPLVARTALVMITAFDAPKRGQAAIGAGFARYLTKPVRRCHLHDCIVEALAAPAPPADGDRRAAQRETAAVAVASRPERILLVEDDPVNRLLARRQLEKLGFASDAVEDGEQAVRAVEHAAYDLVLMDCQMPVLDGFEATRAIRSREAETGRHVTIVAMTANARSDDRDACIEAGMDDYLAKPVQLAQLRTMLDARLPAPAHLTA